MPTITTLPLNPTASTASAVVFQAGKVSYDIKLLIGQFKNVVGHSGIIRLMAGSPMLHFFLVAA